jgi:hypothetical protein
LLMYSSPLCPENIPLMVFANKSWRQSYKSFSFVSNERVE